MGDWGGGGLTPPPPTEKIENYRVCSNSGPEPAFNVGLSMAYDGLLLVAFGPSLPSSIKTQTEKTVSMLKKKLDPLLQNFLDPRMCYMYIHE